MSAVPSTEMETVIDEALIELDASALEAAHHNDPLHRPFRALALFLRALRWLYAEAARSLTQQIEAARQPVRDDDLRRAVIQGVSSHAHNIRQELLRRNALIAATVLVATLAVGLGAGYRLHGDAPVFAGVRAGLDRCEDRSDGARVCYIPVFERLPTTR